MKVGFVGAGRMGAPMVRRLVEAGHEVRALGRTPDKRAAVEELGATAVTGLAQTGADAGAVVICVFSDNQVRQVCLESDLLANMPQGSVLVVHTTGSPRTAEAVAAAAEPHGVAVLDAPVSGGPYEIAPGTLTLFVGGDEATVSAAEPVLRSYGDPVLHVGPLGSGQKVKLVNNTLFAAQIGLVAEGVRLGNRLGVDESTLLTALPHGSATSRALDLCARAGSASAFIAGVAEFVGKDVAVVRKIVAELGGSLQLLDDVVSAGVPESP